jgi:hypothetical protein
MKKLLIILGLVIISLSAMAQGTIETMRDAGDSLTTAPYNGYLYGVYGSTQFVYRPYAVYPSIVGTPADNRVGVWTSANGIEGTSAFTFNSTTGRIDLVAGDANSSAVFGAGLLSLTYNAMQPVSFNGTLAAGSSAESHILDTDNEMTNSTGRLFAVKNNSTRMFSVGIDGSTVVASGGTIGIGSTTLNETVLGYLDFTSSGQDQLGAKVDTSSTFDYDTTVWMLTDTIILGAFSAVDSFNTSFIYGSFYQGGSDTLVVTEMMACLQGTTPSLTVDIEWHATLGSGSATGLNTTPPTITSVTTGDSDTTFDNAEIPPGVFVWLKTPTVTTAPTFMTVTLLGYRKNSTY